MSVSLKERFQKLCVLNGIAFTLKMSFVCVVEMNQCYDLDIYLKILKSVSCPYQFFTFFGLLWFFEWMLDNTPAKILLSA